MSRPDRPMTTRSAVLAAALAAVSALAGCGADAEQAPPTDLRPSPTGPPAEQLAEFTGLTPPDSAEGLEVAFATTDDGRLRMEGSFATDRAGAEAFCAADGIGAYPDPEGPDEEDREAFGTAEETVDGSTSCRGAALDSSQVQRDVLVLYPAEDQASVHVLAYEYE
ncbi:hypothetical protein ACFOVU_26610 [Nocardiopsis sediminis]|uniref:Uncharacterized protein n=1 Tax=Nocardiopsis sediminis TaxID=1778267 RepID=A0ABV8FYF2_9ACTN